MTFTIMRSRFMTSRYDVIAHYDIITYYIMHYDVTLQTAYVILSQMCSHILLHHYL